MLKSMSKKIYDFTLYDALKIMAIVIMFLYFFTFIYGFEIFDMSGADSMESDDFTFMMGCAVTEMGGAFIWGSIMILAFAIKGRVLSCIAIIISYIMQLIYLGIPNVTAPLVEIPQLLYESINVQRSLKLCFETARSNGAEIAMNHCARASQSVLLIQITLVLALILTVYILYKTKKSTYLEEKKDIELESKRGFADLLLYANNIVLIILLVALSILYDFCVMDAFDIRGWLGHYRQFKLPEEWDLVHYFDRFRQMVAPFMIFLMIIVSELIKKKKYLLMLMAYAGYGLALKNVVYFTLEPSLSYKTYDIWEFYFYDECIEMALIVVVLVAIWKYVVSNIISLIKILKNRSTNV